MTIGSLVLLFFRIGGPFNTQPNEVPHREHNSSVGETRMKSDQNMGSKLHASFVGQ